VAPTRKTRLQRERDRRLHAVRITAVEWRLGVSAERKLHLCAAPDAPRLIELIAGQARSESDQAVFCWEAAVESIGSFRVKALFPCSPEIYDWLFNGPTGYRAHYYSAVSTGEAFNRRIVAALEAELIQSLAWPDFNASIGNAGLQSLSGPWSKIALNDCAFREAPERELLPKLWVENCRPGAMGPRAPRPNSCSVEVVGTWLNSVTGTFWNSPEKADRSAQIHLRGFA
jgi:hypothetical protein